MHVLMLGWEFPPFITGGLGTACYGLTRALDQRGLRVTFVLPTSVDSEHAAHVNLVSPGRVPSPGRPPRHEGEPPQRAGEPPRPRDGSAAPHEHPATESRPGFEHVRFLGVESELKHPYQREAGETAVGELKGEWITEIGADGKVVRRFKSFDAPSQAAAGDAEGAAAAGLPAAGSPEYQGDLIGQVERYARFCVEATRGMKFDLIHAHDWMTYPAGLWIARATGRPLVVHIHSTEFDRSGEHVNQRIYDLERRGMHGAMRVIAVSQLTKNVVVNRYAVPDRRVEVVYNGVELDATKVGLTGIERRDKIVLYFGRITYQKGPEYFIRAAQRVLEHMDDVKFVVAGSGDQARGMIEMAAHLGIGHRVLFTGFLRGDDIKKVFALADLYVMPSISEPFGIAPLEAIGHDVPVLISKSSGVSEVLSHALKVDFWDVNDMADKIIAVLKYPPLGATLREHGSMEVRQLTWDGAASRCESIYHDVMSEMQKYATVAAR